MATRFRQLGRVFLPSAAPGGPERIVALHEITLAANIDLLRNRVGLRRLVARGIDEVNAHAVLAFSSSLARRPIASPTRRARAS